MATLIEPGKLKRIYYLAEGRKVPKGTPGAVEKNWTNAKYYVQYKDKGKLKRVPAFKDKRASEQKLRQIELDLERGEMVVELPPGLNE